MQRVRPVRRILQCYLALPIRRRCFAFLSSNSSRHEPQLNKPRPRYALGSPFTRNLYHSSELEKADTIYALSTGQGKAAIAIIRISGPACLSIYSQLCPSRPWPKPRTATLRKLQSPTEPHRTLDTGALLLYFPSPQTVTGEDVLELHIHGGPAIVRSLLESIPQCAGKGGEVLKIRPAEPGEFTKRAFYNGRIDLAEVEALGDALAAETEQQQKLAVSGASSGLTQRYEQWRSMLLYARGELEALIDFSEDQHFDESPAEFMDSVSKQVLSLKQQLELHILNSSRGELLRNGINVALLGAPNAGKSSLLNRIVGREAAIVSAEEGTTRDIVDVSIDIQGWLVRLGDMAGLRADLTPSSSANKAVNLASNDTISAVGEIEREGIRRARERALQSDLVIVLISLEMNIDGNVQLVINNELISAVHDCIEAGKSMLFTINKIDLLHIQTGDRKISISKILSNLIQVFPEADFNDVFCLSCRDAEHPKPSELDAGGLQTFLAGLTKKFNTMTSAVARSENAEDSFKSDAEAQSYWTASLSVSHRQSQFLQECLTHLQNFLEIACQNAKDHCAIESTEQRRPQIPRSAKEEIFGTTDVESKNPCWQPIYHVDNHDDIVAEAKDVVKPMLPVSSKASSLDATHIPSGKTTVNVAVDSSSSTDHEIDIVTAAEHLRYAADCLAKLTGRGDGVSSGADVEDVLGVVFEKFCVGK